MHRFVGLLALGLLMTLLAGSPAQDKAQRSPAEQAAIAKIQKLGGLVMELAQNDSHLEVTYLQTDTKFSDDHVTPLKDLKDLAHLNLRGQEVTDAQLAHLKGLTGLTRLHLEKTKVTDKGLENLKGLVNLEYLNLYSTAVTDAGLANLKGMKKLKNLYVWQTKVTMEGAKKLKEALPQVDIELGLDLEKPKVEKPAPPKKEEPKKK
jgi:hypothetical protein